MTEAEIHEALSAYGAGARSLIVSDRRVRQAVEVASQSGERPAERRRRLPTLASGLAMLLICGAIAVPASAALSSALDAFLDGGDPPGAQIVDADLPQHLHPDVVGEGIENASVVAGEGDQALIAYAAEEADQLCFDYGGSVGECASAEYWRQQLAESAVILRGPSPPDADGTANLYGFTEATVSEVELRYGDGSSTTASAANGGFVVATDPSRDPQELIALDAAGEALLTVDLSDRI